jgi:hypothetical protein
MRVVRDMSGAALYLHLQALGLELALAQQSEHPDGYVVRTWGLADLEPGDAEQVRGLVRANRPALVALLKSGSPAALAVRQEGGGHGSNKRSREEAA